MTITEDQVQWEYICEWESDIDPYKDLADCMTKEEIKANIVKPSYTNPWKWGDVEVKGTYRGLLTSSEYLGACSYKNQKDFIANSGYCEDMQATVLEDLNSQLQTLLT